MNMRAPYLKDAEVKWTRWQRLMLRLSYGQHFTMFDVWWSRWHAKAERKTLRKSERYAEIERLTDTGHGTHLFDADLMDESYKIFWKINRRPLYWHIHHWWDNHGWRAQRSEMKLRRQRAQRGWADRDTWCLDSYVGQIFIESLAHLRDTCHGYPGTPSCPTPERWTEILNEIIDGFEAAADLRDLKYDYKNAQEEQALRDRFDNGMKLLHEFWFALWD